MSENSIAFSTRFDSVEQLQLVKSVIGLLPFRSLLPPPITIRLEFLSEGRLEATAAGSLHDGDDSVVAFCEVTGCLDPDIRAGRSDNVESFREWALSTPEHPLAVRYQPLSAWLLAARCDSRFLRLADEFVQSERVRLRFDLMKAARLLGSRLDIRRRA